MSASIFGERAAIRDKPAWWDIDGQFVFEDTPGAVEAFERAKMDYEVVKLPTRIALPDEWNVPNGNGGSYLTPHYAVVRAPTEDDPEPRVFAHVSEQYEILGNMALANLIEPLTEAWPVETAVALKNGQHVVLSLAAGTSDVKGDELQDYFVVTNDHSGGEGVRIMYTPVRVVCWNTLVMGAYEATEMVTIRHTGDVEAGVAFQAELMQRLRKQRQDTLDLFDAMAETELDEDEMAAVFEAAWPNPEPRGRAKRFLELDGLAESDPDFVEKHAAEWAKMERAHRSLQRTRERNKSYREAAHELVVEYNSEYPQFANTAWMAYGLVATEIADWREGRGAMGESALLHSRADEKVKAFQAAARFAAN